MAKLAARLAVSTGVFSGEPTLTVARDHGLVYVMHAYWLPQILLAKMAQGAQGAWVQWQWL